MKYLILIITLFLSTVTFSYDVMYVKATKLNIHNEPSVGAEIIGQLINGDEVWVKNIINGWAELSTESENRNFVSADYLVDDKSETIESENTTASKEDKSTKSFLVTLLFVLVAGLFVVYKLLNLLGDIFGSSKSKTKSSKHTTPKSKLKTDPRNIEISDISISSNNHLSTLDVNGKKIADFFLPNNEEFLDFTSSFFITKNNIRSITTYDVNCKKIKNAFLSESEAFRSCSGNTYSTINGNGLITTYDRNCKKINSRFS